MKKSKIYFILCLLFISRLALNAQIVASGTVCGQNAWMPDSCGGTKLNGNLEHNWDTIKKSNVTLIRFGGTKADADKPTPTQYLKIIDSVRARGMEPILQVSYDHGTYDTTAAQQLVKFINVTKGKHVKYWSIANEPDKYSGYTYAKKFAYIKDFAIAMKNIDPTIKIIGPEFSYTPGDDNDLLYKVIDTLLMHSSSYNICDLIPAGHGQATGKGYIDYFSCHQYDNGNANRNRSYYINTMVAAKTQTLFSRDTVGFSHLKRQVKIATTAASRSSLPIKAMITEANITTQTGSVLPIDDSFRRNKASSHFAGQHWSEMAFWAAYEEMESINFWSSTEGNGMSYLTDSSNGRKKSTYYHLEQVAKWFKDTLFIGNDDSLGTGTNSKSFKSFGCKGSGYAAILVLNEDTSSQPDKIYEVGLNNNSTSNTKTRVNYGMHLNKTYTDTIQSAATTLLIFNCNGDISAKYRYWLKDSTTTNYQFKSAWAGSSPASYAKSVSAGADATVYSFCAHTYTATPTPSGSYTYQWYANGSPVGTNSSTYTRTNNDGQSKTITVKITSSGCTATDDALFIASNDASCSRLMSPGHVNQGNTVFNSSIESIAPNPTDGKVEISYVVATGSRSAEIMLINYSGQLVSKYNLNTTDNKLEIDTRMLSAGLYFTTLVVDGKKISTKKLIVTK